MTQTVLVTGANGFVASWVVKVFLQKGFHVRAAVRSERSTEGVKKIHQEHASQLSFAIVPDITAPGAFDEAVKGVVGIIHTASPFVLDAKDFEKDLYQPAVSGTLGVLTSAKKYGTEVKRVVITSSFAAIIDPLQGERAGYTYSEKDWNPMTKENSTNGVTAYLTSKTLAEKAGWDFIESEKPKFSLAVVAPPMVYGPPIQEVLSLKSINTSSADIYRLINGTTKEVPGTEFWAYADVRDLAQAHFAAFEKPEAANQRFLVAQGGYTYEQFIYVIREKYPQLKDKTPNVTSSGFPAFPNNVYKVDNSRSKDILGLKYLSFEQTVTDTVDSLLALEKRLA